MTRPAQSLARALEIREREGQRVLLMAAYLLLIIAAYSITKSVRDSLFVTKVGPAQLPYVYLLIAGAMGVFSIGYSRAVALVGLHRLIRLTSLTAVCNLLIFWLLFRHPSVIWSYVLYVWVSLFGSITASQFWLLATHVFNPREARRVFAWLGVGGILGGILGGGVTNLVAHRFGTEALLILSAATMAASVILLDRVVPFATDNVEREEVAAAPESSEGRALFRQVRESRHLSMIVLLLSVALIVEAFIDYEYKFVATQSFGSKNQLTAFFGSIAFYTGIFSLLFQLLITNRILKRLGVIWAILILPSGLFAAFTFLAIKPVLWAAALVQLVDGGFSYSIHRAGMELLYLPVPPKTRNAVKGFIDMFVDRSGRAIGALLLLFLTGVLSFSIPALSIVAAGLTIVWIGMSIAVKREYMHSFRQALERKSIEPEALQLRNLDSGTVKTLLRTLSGNDERAVLYALDLLSYTKPDRWRTHIERLIRHPSSAVRARAIALLASWNDRSIAKDEFIHHPDYETARIAAATALRFRWTGLAENRTLLDQLLQDSSIEVKRQALATAGVVKYGKALPVLIDNLAVRGLRRDVRTALLHFGKEVVPELMRRLLARDSPDALRIRIPKALALTESQEAADGLMHCLGRLDYPLESVVLRALNRTRIDSPQIVFDSERVIAAIDFECGQLDILHSVLSWQKLNARPDPVSRLLTRAIGERLDQRLERIFRLLGLIYPPRDVYAVYFNCQVKPALRASAIEFFDNLLDLRLKERIIPRLEQDKEEPGQPISRHSVFRFLMDPRDPWIRTIATEFRKNETSDEYVNAG